MAHRFRFMAVGGFLLVPTLAFSQSATTGAIAGSVTDSTRAVLPGVSVEASSPALIEKSRSVVSDDQGRYNIVDLRPGTYTVTFTLPGFSTVKREGVLLTSSFTATVNAELNVGSVEESVVVTGASPVVDTQNVRTQNVLSRQALDTLPTGRSVDGYIALTVGATRVGSTPGPQDVGGLNSESAAAMQIHGNKFSESRMYVDGMPVYSSFGNWYRPSQMIVQEMVLETGSTPAEGETGGVMINVVPKDGGNRLTLNGVVNGSFKGLHGDNVSQAMRDQGLRTASLKKLYDYGIGSGFPIKKDGVWVYTAHRWWGSEQYQPGKYFNKTPHTLFYTPDLDRPAWLSIPNQDNTLRVTWRITDKQKISEFVDYQDNCYCFATLETNRAPEATLNTIYKPTIVAQTTWSYPVTSRLLLEAGFAANNYTRTAAPIEGVLPNDIPITELSTGFAYGARASSMTGLSLQDKGTSYKRQSFERFSVSYVTGSHATKIGMTHWQGNQTQDSSINESLLGPVAYNFRNGLPASIVMYGSPLLANDSARNIALFAQDQWRVKRATLNLGVRYDQHIGWVPAQSRPAGAFVPAMQFEKVTGVPSLKDVEPRLGVAYDLFGNGKTAIKGFVGKYVGLLEAASAAYNPARQVVSAATRTWNDANRDFVPQPDELGPLSNSAFGTVVANVTRAPELKNDFRPYSWQWSAAVQHELLPGVGLMAGYFRTAYGNFTVTDNELVGPANYDPFCVTAPVDSRLPGGGGNQICGFYDIRPAVFGRSQNVIKPASVFGERSDVFNGFDTTVTARFGARGLIAGGVSTGQTVLNNCTVVDTPEQRFCEVTTPFLAQTQLKVNAIFPLPAEFTASAVFQHTPGIPITASYVATNAEIARTLGRNLAACGTQATCTATATVELIEPNTMFGERQNQLDLRLSRTFKLRGVRLQGQVDLFNVLNTNTVNQTNTRYGPTWLQPQQILPARLVKVGMQVDF